MDTIKIRSMGRPWQSTWTVANSKIVNGKEVYIDGYTSVLKHVWAGIPKGSVLLFMIIIKDTINSINSYVRLFADNISVCYR